jgi:hypothetical protein
MGNLMVDAVQQQWSPDFAGQVSRAARRRTGFSRLIRRRSTIALIMCLPLIAIVGGLIIYPAFY